MKNYRLFYSVIGITIAAYLSIVAFAFYREEAAARYLFDGEALYRNGDYIGAIRCFRRSLRWESSFAAPRLYLASSLYQIGQFSRAEAEFKRSARDNAGNTSMEFNGLGCVFIKERHFNRAVSALEVAAREDPKEPVVHHNLAIALERSGRKSDSLIEQEKAKVLSRGASSKWSGARLILYDW